MCKTICLVRVVLLSELELCRSDHNCSYNPRKSAEICFFQWWLSHGRDKGEWCLQHFNCKECVSLKGCRCFCRPPPPTHTHTCWGSLCILTFPKTSFSIIHKLFSSGEQKCQFFGHFVCTTLGLPQPDTHTLFIGAWLRFTIKRIVHQKMKIHHLLTLKSIQTSMARSILYFLRVGVGQVISSSEEYARTVHAPIFMYLLQ